MGDRTTKISLVDRMRACSRSALNSSRRVGVYALGLKPQLDANESACQQLFSQARFYREKVTQYKGAFDVQVLRNLNTILDDISAFEQTVGKGGSLVGMHAILERQRIESFDKRLDDAWSRFQADITVRHKCHPSLSSAPFPLDQIAPILPKPVPDYVGHEGEVKDLVAVVRDTPSAHTIILGTGGIGKTALATQVMYDEGVESEFQNRRFFVDCDGILSAEGIVTALAHVFGVTESPGSNMHQALLHHLCRLRTRLLIVLDNLESAWLTDDQRNVETVLSHICDIKLIAVIVTMRGTSPPDGPVWHYIINLEPLDEHDAHCLFIKLHQQAAPPSEQPDLNELLGLLDGLPLAITLLASVGLTMNYSTSELLAAYRNESTGMATRGLGNSRRTSLDISIGVSIQCRTMRDNPQALQLLGLLSLLPDGLHEKELADVFPRLKDIPSVTRILVQVALCTRRETTYRVLAPIRAYLQARCTLDDVHLKELRQYYFRLALRSWRFESYAVMKEVQSKINNIQAVLIHAMTKGRPVDAPDVLQALVALSGFSYMTSTADCKPCLQAALSAYRNLGFSQGGRERLLARCGFRRRSSTSTGSLLARCRIQLSEALHLQRDYEASIAVLKEGKTGFDGDGHRLGAAACAEELGTVLYSQDDFEGATAALEEAKATYQAIGYRPGVAECIQKLSGVMMRQGNFEGATVAAGDAKAAFEAIGDSDGAASCMKTLSDVMTAQGNYKGAIAILGQAKAAFQANGRRLFGARCAQCLAEVKEMQGDYEGATIALREAKTLFHLGHVMPLQDNSQSATRDTNEATVSFSTFADRLGEALSTQRLGEVMYLRGNYGGATIALEEARAAYQEIGFRLGAAQCTRTLGGIMYIQGNYESATPAYEEAKTAFLGLGDRLRAAGCTTDLGKVMVMQGNYQGATTALEEAEAVFDGIERCHLSVRQCTWKSITRLRQLLKTALKQGVQIEPGKWDEHGF